MTLSRKTATSASELLARLSLGSALLLALLAVALPQPALAWSEAGHVTIAEFAMRRLPEQERRLLNTLATRLVSQDAEATSMRSRYGDVSAMALAAPWLDNVRGRELKDIFEDFGKELPRALAGYESRTTNDWHYDNRPWHEQRATSGCNDVDGGQLNSVMPLLIEAFREVDDPRDKAIVLAMLTHLVADAHQPLHTVTRVADNCQHDRGGNGFCVKRAGGACELNLHQVWDRGFGIFKGKVEDGIGLLNVAPAVERTGFQPNLWQEENLAFAEQVYPSPDEQVSDVAYQRKGRQITLRRARQAGERLAVLLVQLAREAEQANRKALKTNTETGTSQ